MRLALLFVVALAACSSKEEPPPPPPPPAPKPEPPKPPPPPEAFCFNNRGHETIHGKPLPPTTCSATLAKCNDNRQTTDGECLPVPNAFSIKMMRNDGKVEVGWLFATEADCRAGYELAKKTYQNPDEIVIGCWYGGKRLERGPKLAINGIDPVAGDTTGGTLIRILGSGFTSDGPRAAKVFFGTKPGMIVRFASDGELLVKSPAGKAGDVVDVSVVFEPGGELKIPKDFYENKKGFAFAEKKLKGAHD